MPIFKANKDDKGNNSQENNNSQEKQTGSEANFEPGKLDEVLNAVKATNDSVIALATRMDGLETGQKELRESTVIQTNYNKIYTSAKSFGASHEEADKLAKDSEKTHEQKLDECLSNAMTFKNNATKAFKGTKPSGSLDTDELLDNDDSQEDKPKNRSEAVVKVKKDLNLKGREAVVKAEELYPEACNRLKAPAFLATNLKTFV